MSCVIEYTHICLEVNGSSGRYDGRNETYSFLTGGCVSLFNLLC